MGHTHKKCSFLVSTWSLILFQKFINILGIHTKHCSFVVFPQVPQIISRVNARNWCSFLFWPLVSDYLFLYKERQYIWHTHTISRAYTQKQCSFVFFPRSLRLFQGLMQEIGVISYFGL